MSKLTTGPFRVPDLSAPGINIIVILIIGLKNPTNKTKTVVVTVERAPQAVFPVTSLEGVIFGPQSVTLDPQETTQIFIVRNSTFVETDMLRVNFEGDIQKDGKAIEAFVVGRDDNAGVQEPTMFFRHDDLVETKN